MGKKAVFGRELAEAYQATKPLPTLIESSTHADDAHSILNEIILQMTVFESKTRISMNDAIKKLRGEIIIINKYHCGIFQISSHVLPKVSES